MARKHREEDELPFVALMDTMTNVVGVLIIVLVMVGLGIATTVKRVLSELPPVTVEEFADLKKQIDETPKTPATPESVEKEIKEKADKLKKATEELSTIDLTKEKQNVKFINLDDLNKQIESAKQQRDYEKAKLDKLFADVTQLQKSLADIPEYKAPPPKYVRIPNPRPVPANAVRENFLLAKGRVYYLNDRAFLDVVQKEFDKNRAAFLAPNHPKVTSKTPPASIHHSKDRVMNYFSKAKIGDRNLQLSLLPLPNAPVFNVQLTPVETGGEGISDIKNPASVFQRAMRKFKSEPNKVVWLYVFKDSVETYLAAREIADVVGVPVGWQIYAQDFFSVRLPVITYEPFTPPPPPKAPATPAPKSEIVPPKEQLD